MAPARGPEVVKAAGTTAPEASAPRPAPAEATRTTAALPSSAPAAATATEPAEAKPAAPPATSIEALRKGLADAREAYAAGKPEAVLAYAELAKRFPENPDVTGELGNVLYQQGKMEEAGEQFYETALRLIRAHQEARAACLVDVLRQLAPVRARDLERQTTATCPVSVQR